MMAYCSCWWWWWWWCNERQRMSTKRDGNTCPSFQLTPLDVVDDVIVDRGEGRPINWSVDVRRLLVYGRLECRRDEAPLPACSSWGIASRLRRTMRCSQSNATKRELPIFCVEHCGEWGKDGGKRSEKRKSGFGFLERVAQVRLFWREAAPSHVGISTSTNSMCFLYLMHTAHARTHVHGPSKHTNSRKSKSQPNLFPPSTKECVPSSTKICIDELLFGKKHDGGVRVKFIWVLMVHFEWRTMHRWRWLSMVDAVECFDMK